MGAPFVCTFGTIRRQRPIPPPWHSANLHGRRLRRCPTKAELLSSLPRARGGKEGGNLRSPPPLPLSSTTPQLLLALLHYVVLYEAHPRHKMDCPTVPINNIPHPRTRKPTVGHVVFLGPARERKGESFSSASQSAHCSCLAFCVVGLEALHPSEWPLFSLRAGGLKGPKG